MHTGDLWITSSELSDRWKIHKTTLASWRSKSFGPQPQRKGKKLWYYYMPEVLEFERKNPVYSPQLIQDEEEA